MIENKFFVEGPACLTHKNELFNNVSENQRLRFHAFFFNTGSYHSNFVSFFEATLLELMICSLLLIIQLSRQAFQTSIAFL